MAHENRKESFCYYTLLFNYYLFHIHQQIVRVQLNNNSGCRTYRSLFSAAERQTGSGFCQSEDSMVKQTHLVDTLIKSGINVVKIFSPEHGFRGDADAGEELNNSTDKKTGITIISLYGNHNKPTADDLKDVDVILFDIQDVGARFYTYISSLQYYFLEACIAGKS